MWCEVMPARTGWLGSRSGRILAQDSELPRPLEGECGSCSKLFRICQKGGVAIVPIFGFEFGRTSAGLARIAYVFWTSQCFQGPECSSSPTLGTA
jgi:hypothetical protein